MTEMTESPQSDSDHHEAVSKVFTAYLQAVFNLMILCYMVNSKGYKLTFDNFKKCVAPKRAVVKKDEKSKMAVMVG